MLEIPTNILYHQDEETDQVPGAKVYEPDQLRSQGDPRSIERDRRSARAQRTAAVGRRRRHLLVGRRGRTGRAGRADAHAGLSRRAGHGALAEDHPLAVQGAWKKPFTGRADLVIAVGFRFWSGEKFGQPPTWTDKATYVQIDATPARIGWQVPAEVAIVGDPKLVLRQLIDAVKARKKDFPPSKNSTWLGEVATARDNFRKLVRERAGKVRGELPIHPDRLIGDLVSVADKDATIVIDSFTLSGYISHWWTVRFPGQIVDAGPLAPVGHGIGMAIGAQLGPAGQAGDHGDRRRRHRHRRLGPGNGRQVQHSDRGRAVEQQFLGPELRADAAAQGPHRSVRHASRHPLRPHFQGDGLPRRTRRAGRTKSCPPCERAFDSRQAGRDQRGGRQADRPSHAGRQPAGLDAGMRRPAHYAARVSVGCDRGDGGARTICCRAGSCWSAVALGGRCSDRRGLGAGFVGRDGLPTAQDHDQARRRFQLAWSRTGRFA